MKITAKRHKEYDEEYVHSVECDICHKVYIGVDWEKTSPYEILETSVKMRTGVQYPESGHYEEIKFDICPTCFEHKLIPVLSGLGASPSIDSDYF